MKASFSLGKKVATKATLALAATLSLSACLPETYVERDVRDDVFYFVMPDRFNNGDTTNDLGDLGGDKYTHGFDPTHKAWYHGGDMRGLEDKLDYLQDMGITAIWMTPILKNKAVQGESSAYHGYWTLDFTQIDPHLGSNEDLVSLIDAAHARDIKVFFDIITNHTADVIKYEECHNPDGTFQEGNTGCAYKSLEQVANGDTYTPFVPAGEELAKVPEWLNDPKYYHNQGDSTFSGENSVYGDFFGLDDVKTGDPEVVAGMIDIFKNIVTEFKPDGFRIDTVKHVNIEFWQEFSPAIMEHAQAEGIPNFFMFGEVYDGNPAYLSQFTTTGKLPSVLDFGIQGAGSSVFASNGPSTNLKDLFDNDDYYNDADSDASKLMNFMGNHDMGRIGMFINNGNPDADDAEKLARMKLANAFMFFARGIPVIYYGDEQGFTGDGGDQDARENMFPSQVDIYNDNDLIGTDATTAIDNFDTTHPLYQAFGQYAELYKQHYALRHGVQAERYAEDGGLYAFSRFDLEDPVEYLAVFNNDEVARDITLAATSKKYRYLAGGYGKVKAEDGNISLTVPALDFVILKAKKAMDTAPVSSFSITGLEEGQVVAGRVGLDLSVDELEGQAIAGYQAQFELSVNGGEFAPMATDNTAPYRLFWDTSAYEDGTEVTIQVTLNNFEGEGTSQQINLIVDSRVPETVTLDYENGNGRDLMFVVNNRGGFQGPVNISGGAGQFGWGADDQTNLIIFADIDGNTVALDTPVLVSRNDIVKLSTPDAEGNLQASVFLNSSHQFDTVDNDDGTAPSVVALDPAAPAPLGDDLNLRGGLNGWATDLMTYLGNNTYHVSRVVDKGDAEFKFADSTWSVTNIGGPVTETGLTAGSNPSNMLNTFPLTNVYNFYLIKNDSYTLDLITPDYGFVGQPLYLRGLNTWDAVDQLSYLGDATYEITMPVNAGAYQFKFAVADWSSEWVVADANMADGELDDLIPGGGQPNISFTADESAYYTFTLTLDETNSSATVAKGAPLGEDQPPYDNDLYIKGELNGWADVYPMTYAGNGVYRQVLLVDPTTDGGDGDIQFKIADSSWSAPNLGAATFTLGSPIALDGGSNPANIPMPTPASRVFYEFVLDASNVEAPTLTVNPTAAMAVHYNRVNGDYDGWGLHLWGEGVNPDYIPTWAAPLHMSYSDSFGQFGLFQLSDPFQQVGFILHKGDEKNSAADLFHTPDTVAEVWINEGDSVVYLTQADAEAAQP